MIFAKGKPLGPEGLNWLKTHCVNLTGKMKKQSLAARYDAIVNIFINYVDNYVLIF